jgi:general secretion pathway protein B
VQGEVAEPLQPEPVPEPSSPPAHTAPLSESAEKRPAVPDDLRRDIEAFKEEVRRTQGGEPKKAKNVRPQDLRLPKDVEKRLPAFLMTVHIYDPDPAKRFVLINARKLREGDRTRQDIVVEEILPDGVVLSWEDHRFFRHR